VKNGEFSEKIQRRPLVSHPQDFILHSPFSEKATKGCHTFLHGEAILLAPLFPHSSFSENPFSDLREDATTPYVCGCLGEYSRDLIKCFANIEGVRLITHIWIQPAAWMLEVTVPTSETKLRVNFARIFGDSEMNKRKRIMIKELMAANPGSQDSNFLTRFSQSTMVQFKACL
jgi:hypothetical protein